MIYGPVSPFSARVLTNFDEGVREKTCLLVDRSSRQVFLQSSSRLQSSSFNRLYDHLSEKVVIYLNTYDARENLLDHGHTVSIWSLLFICIENSMYW